MSGEPSAELFSIWGLSWWQCAATAVTLLMGYNIWHFTQFLRSGIPGPLPIPFYANIKRSKEAFYLCEQKWIDKYGKVMGFFSIAGPTLVIADVKILKQMLIKHFNNFQNRGQTAIFTQSTRLSNMLITLKDQHWRNTRHTIIPAFTSSKIKQMAGLLNECTEDIILQKLRQLDGEAVEIKKLYGAYSICCIAVAGFGVQLKDHSEDGNSTLATFEKNAKDFFARQKETKWLIMAIVQDYLPSALIRYFDIGLVSQASENFFFDLSAEIFEKRRKSDMQGTFVDFMQLMINAHELEDEEYEDSGQRSPQEAGPTKVQLSMDVVFSQCVMFLMAGYETTASCLTFTTYLLASHPAVQEKLVAEIKTVMQDCQSHRITLDLINKMTYLDKVVNESLRLYPPIARLTRTCNKDITLLGLHIKKGTRIITPSFAIHHSPEYWPDPLTFNPDRFSAENDSLNMDAFLAFGDGPRSCLGNRFALAEIKIALARILTEFKMEMAEDTPKTLELGKGVFLAPCHPIPVKFVPVD